MTRYRVSIAVLAVLTLVLFILIPALGDLEGMYEEPLRTGEEFLAGQPHRTVYAAGRERVLTQPVSSGLVFALGIEAVLTGMFFVVARRGQKSRTLWGISVILWGIAAVCAGLSYQCFGYELKARGRDFVLFTSWFEIFYMLIQCCSTSFMLAAVSRMTAGSKKGRRAADVYAAAVSFAYAVVVFAGVMAKNTFVISYTDFLIFVGYNYAVMFAMSVAHYRRHRDPLNRDMMVLWIAFLAVNVCYFIHLAVSDPVCVWKSTGVWFTENDTLHVLLAGWFVLMAALFHDKMADLPLPTDSGGRVRPDDFTAA